MPLAVDNGQMWLTWSACSQTMRKGVAVPAKGETSEEFVDIMVEIRERVKYMLPEALYCFDQPTIHMGSRAGA